MNFQQPNNEPPPYAHLQHGLLIVKKIMTKENCQWKSHFRDGQLSSQVVDRVNPTRAIRTDNACPNVTLEDAL